MNHPNLNLIAEAIMRLIASLVHLPVTHTHIDTVSRVSQLPPNVPCPIGTCEHDLEAGPHAISARNVVMICLLLRPRQLAQLACEVNHAWRKAVVVVLVPSDAIDDAVDGYFAGENS